MVLGWASKVLQNLSAKAVLQRLDKRKLQNELDTHRLFLLTSYFKRLEEGLVTDGQDLAAGFTEQAENLKFEGMQSAVASNLHLQLTSIATALHGILQQQGDPGVPAAQLSLLAAQQAQKPSMQDQQPQQAQQARGQGLAAAFGQATPPCSLPTPPPSPPEDLSKASEAALAELQSTTQRSSMLSAAELTTAFHAQRGFTLRVAPSSIQHSEAGEGLWVEGRVRLGQVVALYPGVGYPPLHYRQIPGYPKIDRGNPYFIGRFDGVVLDAKPWGQGLQARFHTQTGGPEMWPENPLNHAERALQQVEGRHPLALAHFANHPPAGAAPNVMVAAFDFTAPGDFPHLRAYMPNVGYQDPVHGQHAEQGGLSQLVSPADRVAGLALVAVRDLEEEEVFLNYRLSPHVPRPDWYVSVDEEEEQRRWA